MQEIDNFSYIPFFILVAIVTISYYYYDKFRLRKFYRRESLTFLSFYEQFYSDSDIPREVVFRLLKFIGGHFYPDFFLCKGIPPGQLRPNDNFKDIKGVNNFSNMFKNVCDLIEDSWEVLEANIDYEFLPFIEKQEIENDFDSIETIDDFIRTIYELSFKYGDIELFRKCWSRCKNVTKSTDKDI